jgi:hypothetical protein
MVPGETKTYTTHGARATGICTLSTALDGAYSAIFMSVNYTCWQTILSPDKQLSSYAGTFRNACTFPSNACTFPSIGI